MRAYEPPYAADFSQRDPAAGVDELFYKRWSPRAFRKMPLPEEMLRSVFDAARWAPSSYNAQPWMFITNTDDADFSLFCSLLNEGNQKWAQNASLLGFIAARKHFGDDNRPNQCASFDCGAAWLCMTLQARRFGLYTHGMAGIKREAVYATLGIDAEKYHVICGFALGVLAAPTAAAPSSNRKPSPRRPLHGIWHRGKL